MVRTSEIFENAFSLRISAGQQSAFHDALLNFEFGAERDPRAVGVKHPGFPDKEYWVYEVPRLYRLPRITFLYEIDDDAGVVTLWNFDIN